MRKYSSLFLLALVFTLSGCGQATAYEQMLNKLGNVNSMRYAMVELGASVKGVNVSLTLELDPQTPLTHLSFLGQDLYLNDTALYGNLSNKWYKVNLTKDQIASLKEESNVDVYKINMPKGDETISFDSKYDMLDKAINGKTLNDIVVATDKGYSVSGLEKYLTVTVSKQQLSFKFTDQNSGDSIFLTYGKTDKFKLPKEADNATSVPANVLENL